MKKDDNSELTTSVVMPENIRGATKYKLDENKSILLI